MLSLTVGSALKQKQYELAVMNEVTEQMMTVANAATSGIKRLFMESKEDEVNNIVIYLRCFVIYISFL